MVVRAWTSYLAIAAAATLGIAVLPAGHLSVVAYLVIAASSFVCGCAVARQLVRAGLGDWRFGVVVVGGAALLLVDAVVTRAAAVDGTTLTWLELAPRLVAYTFISTSLMLAGRQVSPVARSTSLLDSTLFVLAAGLVSWVLLVAPTWRTVEASGLGSPTTAVAASVADLVLLAGAVVVATSSGYTTWPGRLFVAGVAVLLVTDSLIQAAVIVPGLASHVGTIATLRILALVLWGAAALHPLPSQLTEPVERPADTLLTGRLVALAITTTVGPAILTAQHLAGRPVTLTPVLAVAPAVIALVAIRVIAIVRHLSAQTRALGRLAETDYVTGLANRRRFSDDLTQFRDTHPAAHAVLFAVRLDGLNEVNVTLGYESGDEVLEETGQRLLATMGPGAVVARLGGDTYGILARHLVSASDIDTWGARLRAVLEEPYDLNGGASVRLEASVGGDLFGANATAAAMALQHVRSALDAARTRPGRVAQYVAAMDADLRASSQLMGEFRTALGAGQIVVHYQPQVELATGKVFGVEALVRWQHPQRGLLGPAAFLDAIEESGLIGPLTDHVLDAALRQCAEWRAAGLRLVVAVNLSVRNLLDPYLVDDVSAALARHGLDASALELEVTESSAMVDPRRSLSALGALAEMGIALSLDDYGTGYSSLAYLQQLPVQQLKIDRTFVAALTHDANSATIVRSTIELARNLGLTVVAEGVEDDETLGALEDMDCFAAQGFGLGRPVPAVEIPALHAAIESRLRARHGDAVLDQTGTRAS